MSNGILDFFDPNTNSLNITVPIGLEGTPPIIPDEPLPSPQDIAISEGARILTETINSGIGVDVVNQLEGEQFIREGILAGNPGVVQDIIVNKINSLDDRAKGAIANQVFGTFNPALAPLAAANQANQGIQVAGDFVQSGIGALQGRMDPESFGFGALDTASDAIEGIQNISADVVGSANRIVGDLILDPFGNVIGRINQGIIDPLFSPFQDVALNIFGKGKDDDPPVTVDQGQGVVAGKKKGTGNIDMDPNAILQTFGGTTGGTGGGGGADSSKPDFPTGGGNVVISGFTPPSTNVQQETNRIRDILNRRAQGSSQGFNAGGLASIPKYLKGR